MPKIVQRIGEKQKFESRPGFPLCCTEGTWQKTVSEAQVLNETGLPQEPEDNSRCSSESHLWKKI